MKNFIEHLNHDTTNPGEYVITGKVNNYPATSDGDVVVTLKAICGAPDCGATIQITRPLLFFTADNEFQITLFPKT